MSEVHSSCLPAAFAVLVFTVSLPAPAQPPLGELERIYDEAQKRFIRLPPSAFNELPESVTAELNRRGCTIPQSWPLTKRSNVISGSFVRPGQTDWAVICSVRAISTLLVFFADQPQPVDLGPKYHDRSYVGFDSRKMPYFDRTISSVGRKFIMDHYRAYGGLKPPPIEHDGIDQAFLGKASVVHYFHQGKWLKLQGAD